MKKRFKKLAAMLLAATMTMGLVACGNTDESVKDSQVESTATEEGSSEAEEVSSGITFPLEEEVTFTFMGLDSTGQLAQIVENDYLMQKLYEKTNVKIEILPLPATDTMSVLNGLFTSNSEGDVISVNNFSDANIQQLAGAGLLQPLNDYVFDEELMPNFNERVLSEASTMSSVMSFPDGNIYCLPRYDSLKGSFLESTMWINKTWLEQLGEEIPTTLEDFERVLKLFVENDMNGNGKDDEIGILLRQGDGYAHFEALLGMWGIPTKDGTFENYIYLEDGKVIFAPTTETWKEAIKTFNQWYEDGLVWDECFTGTAETKNAKLTSEELIFGVTMDQLPPTGHEDDYVQMTPPTVEGYNTRWYLHPGINGSHTTLAVTRSCENVDILMAWLDQFYSFETTLEYMYGEAEVWNWGFNEEGKFVNEGLSTEEYNKAAEDNAIVRYILMLPYAINSEDYEERVAIEGNVKTKQDNYELYESVLNTELWPRPYIKEEVSTRLTELRTDIFNTLNSKKAEWITGAADIDADWDAYLESMNKMGVEEFTALMQEAYDTFQANLK